MDVRIMDVRIRRKDRPVYRALTIVSFVVLVPTGATLPWDPIWLGALVGCLALAGVVVGVDGWWGVRWREERYWSGGKDPGNVE